MRVLCSVTRDNLQVDPRRKRCACRIEGLIYAIIPSRLIRVARSQETFLTCCIRNFVVGMTIFSLAKVDSSVKIPRVPVSREYNRAPCEKGYVRHGPTRREAI